MSIQFHGFKKLKSGDLTLLYKEGEIRQVCLGRVQVVNAVYAAVRDQNWTTIPFSVVHESIKELEDGFIIGIDLKYSLDQIRYQAKISIEAKGNRLLVDFEGKAGSAFLRNRIGLCILQPIKECRGKPVLISHPEGNQSEGRFPENISPHQPFCNISGMKWNPAKGIIAELRFSGDIFESEDQRNWTDASYKTYCTPLELPFPVKVKPGEKVHQSVTLLVETEVKPDQSYHKQKRMLTIQPGEAHPLPGLGIGRSGEERPLTDEEAALLSTLPFHHYRVDLYLGRKEWKELYYSAARDQEQLGWPLELVLHFDKSPGEELETFLLRYSSLPVHIRQLLVFDQDFLSGKALVENVVPILKAAFPGIPVGGGTDANFAELNRIPPDSDLLDFISYSICPQIHAFDRLTLLENLEAQEESVISAKRMLGKPVSIAAVTLKQRFNAVATDAEDEGQALAEPDPRQHTSFTAGWTLSSIRNLALAGTSTLTYYETVGPRGILSRQDTRAKQSPLYDLFGEILSGNHMQVIQTESSHPLEFDCLALQGQEENLLLLANYTETELSIEVSGVPGIPHSIILKPSEIYNIAYTP